MSNSCNRNQNLGSAYSVIVLLNKELDLYSVLYIYKKKIVQIKQKNQSAFMILNVCTLILNISTTSV